MPEPAIHTEVLSFTEASAEEFVSEIGDGLHIEGDKILAPQVIGDQIIGESVVGKVVEVSSSNDC